MEEEQPEKSKPKEEEAGESENVPREEDNLWQLRIFDLDWKRSEETKRTSMLKLKVSSNLEFDIPMRSKIFEDKIKLPDEERREKEVEEEEGREEEGMEEEGRKKEGGEEEGREEEGREEEGGEEEGGEEEGGEEEPIPAICQGRKSLLEDLESSSSSFSSIEEREEKISETPKVTIVPKEEEKVAEEETPAETYISEEEVLEETEMEYGMLEFLEYEDLEESELEEEYFEPLLTPSELDRARIRRDLDEIMSYEFPQDPSEEEENKLKEYESLIKELGKQEKEMDIMLESLEKNDKLIEIVDKVVDPLIQYYDMTVKAFIKVENQATSIGLEEDEELEEEEEEERAAVEEMVREVLEAEEVESLGSMEEEIVLEDVANFSALEEELGNTDEDLDGLEEEGPIRKVVQKTRAKGVTARKGGGQKGKKRSFRK